MKSNFSNNYSGIRKILTTKTTSDNNQISILYRYKNNKKKIEEKKEKVTKIKENWIICVFYLHYESITFLFKYLMIMKNYKTLYTVKHV